MQSAGERGRPNSPPPAFPLSLFFSSCGRGSKAEVECKAQPERGWPNFLPLPFHSPSSFLPAAGEAKQRLSAKRRRKGGGQTLLPCLSTLPLLSLMRKQGGKRGGESTPTMSIFVCFPSFVGKAILQGARKLTDYKLLGAYSDICYSDTCTIPTIQKSAGVDKNCLIQFSSIYLTYT